MENDGIERSRPWKEIAAEAAKEKDPQRLIELVNELTSSLDSRDGGRTGEIRVRKPNSTAPLSEANSSEAGNAENQ